MNKTNKAVETASASQNARKRLTQFQRTMLAMEKAGAVRRDGKSTGVELGQKASAARTRKLSMGERYADIVEEDRSPSDAVWKFQNSVMQSSLTNEKAERIIKAEEVA